MNMDTVKVGICLMRLRASEQQIFRFNLPPMDLTLEELNAEPTAIFTLLNKVGEGSYGSVYRGIHKKSNTLVAIKLIPADNNLDDAVKEISIMKNCIHTNIVHFYGCYIIYGSSWNIAQMVLFQIS